MRSLKDFNRKIQISLLTVAIAIYEKSGLDHYEFLIGKFHYDFMLNDSFLISL